MSQLGLKACCACAVAVAAFGLTARPTSSAVTQSSIQIEQIRVQFLYETSGTLSEDVKTSRGFSIWNTVIGEGNAAEPAADVLVSAVLSSGNLEETAQQPLTLTVKTAAGKIIAQRTFRHILTEHGRVVKSLLLPEATCAGKLDIEADFGSQRKVESVSLDCGE
jgi:hypothetical protein